MRMETKETEEEKITAGTCQINGVFGYHNTINQRLYVRDSYRGSSGLNLFYDG